MNVSSISAIGITSLHLSVDYILNGFAIIAINYGLYGNIKYFKLIWSVPREGDGHSFVSFVATVQDVNVSL